MPFVKKEFMLPHPMPAFSYIMKKFNFTQGQAQRLIAKGRLIIDNQSHYKSGAIIDGTVQIVYFEPSPKGTRPIFQTNDFMVFEKPSGTLVHPNTMSTPYSMLDEIRAISGQNANATHRIDMETSGLLLASKHKDAEHFLKNSFEIKTIKKSYLAWVDGEIKDPFSVDMPISIRDDYTTCKHKVVINKNGKKAYTDFVPLEYDTDLNATLISCHPATGRTHQIRIHLFHVKHPILGDPLYGTDFDTANSYLEGTLNSHDRSIKTGASRLMLHADALEFKYKNHFFIQSKFDFMGQKNLICKASLRTFNKK